MKRLIFLAVALAGLSSGCYLPQGSPPRLAVTDPGKEKQLPDWYGKKLGDLEEKMGQPTSSVRNDDLTRQLYYSYAGHHYVFGTDKHGVISSAVQVD
jgi:hypothetical protein